MKCIRSFLSEHKHFFMLILLFPLLIWFKYLEMTTVPSHMIFTALDDQIPFIKEFVIPYLLWFPYITYGLYYTGVHSRRDFYRLLAFLAAGMSVACIMYMIFPNAQDLRPSMMADDPFSILVKLIYATDTPTNVLPSIHVINSIAVNAALQHSDSFALKKFGRPAALILTVLICLSTVLIKQHSVLDVGWGMITASLFYLPLYVMPDRRARKITQTEAATAAVTGR